MNPVQAAAADRARETESWLESLPPSPVVDRVRREVSLAISALETREVLPTDSGGDAFWVVGPGGRLFRCERNKEEGMLTQQEEQALRRLIGNSTPMRAVNPQQEKGGERPVVSVETAFGPVAPMKAYDPNEDWDTLARLSKNVWGDSLLRPNEKLTEFYARTGLSRSQVWAMTYAELKAFVAAASEPPQAPRATRLVEEIEKGRTTGRFIVALV